MSYIRHHAIIVTGWEIKKVHNKAKKLFGHLVSPIIDSQINDTYSFLIAPDGGNEGRDMSNRCDAKREKFIEWLGAGERKKADWVHLFYGDEDGECKIIQYSVPKYMQQP